MNRLLVPPPTTVTGPTRQLVGSVAPSPPLPPRPVQKIKVNMNRYPSMSVQLPRPSSTPVSIISDSQSSSVDVSRTWVRSVSTATPSTIPANEAHTLIGTQDSFFTSPASAQAITPQINVEAHAKSKSVIGPHSILTVVPEKTASRAVVLPSSLYMSNGAANTTITPPLTLKTPTDMSPPRVYPPNKYAMLSHPIARTPTTSTTITGVAAKTFLPVIPSAIAARLADQEKKVEEVLQKRNEQQEANYAQQLNLPVGPTPATRSIGSLAPPGDDLYWHGRLSNFLEATKGLPSLNATVPPNGTITIANVTIPPTTKVVAVAGKTPVYKPPILSPPTEISDEAAAARRERQRTLMNISFSGHSVAEVTLATPQAIQQQKMNVVLAPYTPTVAVPVSASPMSRNPPVSSDAISLLFKRMAAHGPIDIATHGAAGMEPNNGSHATSTGTVAAEELTGSESVTMDAATPSSDVRTKPIRRPKASLTEVSNEFSIGAATPKTDQKSSNRQSGSTRKRDDSGIKSSSQPTATVGLNNSGLPTRLSFTADGTELNFLLTGAVDDDDNEMGFDLDTFIGRRSGGDQVDYATPSRKKRRAGNAKTTTEETVPKPTPVPLASVLSEVMECDRLVQMRREATSGYLNRSLSAMSPTNTFGYAEQFVDPHSPLSFRHSMGTFPRSGGSPVESNTAFSPTVPTPTAVQPEQNGMPGQYNPSAEMNLEAMYGDGAGFASKYAPPPPMLRSSQGFQPELSMSMSQAMFDAVDEDERSLSQSLKLRVDAAVQRARNRASGLLLNEETDNADVDGADPLDRTANSDLQDALRSFASVDFLFGDDD